MDPAEFGQWLVAHIPVQILPFSLAAIFALVLVVSKRMATPPTQRRPLSRRQRPTPPQMPPPPYSPHVKHKTPPPDEGGSYGSVRARIPHG